MEVLFLQDGCHTCGRVPWQSANTCRLSYSSLLSVLRYSHHTAAHISKKDIFGIGSLAIKIKLRN